MFRQIERGISARHNEIGLNLGGICLVSHVIPGGSAAEAGIQKDDVILEINRSPVQSVENFQSIVSAAQKGSPLLFLVSRATKTAFVSIKIGGDDFDLGGELDF